jgi:CarD family transcriptional regulator
MKIYAVNDYVVYGNNGVCKITDIRKEKFYGTEEQVYCVLEPVHSNKSTIYTPINRNLDKFRNVMSCEEVYELIHSIPNEETIWIEDYQARSEKFNEILKEGDPKQLIALIKTLYEHQENLLSNGKKMRMSDEKIKRDAEHLLFDEFAYVLDIQPHEVLPFILNELDDKKIITAET